MLMPNAYGVFSGDSIFIGVFVFRPHTYVGLFSFLDFEIDLYWSKQLLKFTKINPLG
jgi:hypothetical protein